MNKILLILSLFIISCNDPAECTTNYFGSSLWNDGTLTYYFYPGSDTVNVDFASGTVKGIYKFNDTCDSLTLSNISLTTNTTYGITKVSDDLITLHYTPSVFLNLIRL